MVHEESLVLIPNIRSADLDYLTFSLKWKVCNGSILGRSSVLSIGNLRCNTALCRDIEDNLGDSYLEKVQQGGS